MHRPIRFRFFLIVAALAIFASLPLAATAESPPNIVVVLADDLGYGNLGCYGNDFVRTPHLDRFAAEGWKFTDCYAAGASCSPSRAGLMTGRTPWRIGIYQAIPMLSPMHVKESEITVATLLHEAGYATCLLVPFSVPALEKRRSLRLHRSAKLSESPLRVRHSAGSDAAVSPRTSIFVGWNGKVLFSGINSCQ